jgi:nucleotide-binding universal stress UspA family protein
MAPRFENEEPAMSPRSILLHVNVSKHCRSRVEIAARLAKSFQARLDGLFTSAASDVPYYMMDEIATNAEPTMRAWWMRARDRAKAGFDDVLRGTGLVAAWSEIDDSTGDGVAREARYADLAIVGQIDPEELLPRPEYKIPERVALEAGGPVLVVPHAGTFATVGRRILIAWNDSPQSARAVRDALPFLASASAVTVLALSADAPTGDRASRPAARVASRLKDRGIAVDVRDTVSGDVEAGEMILSQAADMGADLIVMGAYGHSRASELVLGGTTRTLFRRMTVPTLMSH